MRIKVLIFLAFLLLADPAYSEVSVILRPFFNNSQDLSRDPAFPERYRDRRTYGGIQLGFQAKWESELAYWDGGVDVLAFGKSFSNTESLQLYPAKEANLGFSFPFGNLWIGRKNFYRNDFITDPAFDIRRNEDGGDGIGIQSEFLQNTILQVFAWDFYSGFPLSYFYITPVYGKEEKAQFLSGERYRQGIRMYHSRGKWNLGGDFFYLNLGNWGRSSKDDFQFGTSEGGDGDFLLRYRAEFGYQNEKWALNLEYHLTRGLDKTFAAPERPERSLPIRGEAIVWNFSWKDKGYYFQFFQFFPNTPTTGESLEPITIGYVGMGNSYALGHFFSRERNLYPSVWVTQWGKEWNRWDTNSLFGTRAPAQFSSIEMGVRLSDWSFGIWGEYMLPRRIQVRDKGQISLRKADYEDFFLAESGLRILYNSQAESFQTQLGIEFSHFWSQKDIAVRANCIQAYGRLVF